MLIESLCAELEPINDRGKPKKSIDSVLYDIDSSQDVQTYLSNNLKAHWQCKESDETTTVYSQSERHPCSEYHSHHSKQRSWDIMYDNHFPKLQIHCESRGIKASRSNCLVNTLFNPVKTNKTGDFVRSNWQDHSSRAPSLVVVAPEIE